MIFMNKNRKRLAKLLIPMLALSAINTNAMEKIEPTVRSKSYNKHNKKRSKILMPSLDKFNPGGVVLWNNHKAEKDKYAHVVQYSGPALHDFLQDFEFLETYPGNDQYGADGFINKNQRMYYGHEGLVIKCRHKTDKKVFAVKCAPNAERTGLKTYNNETYHKEDDKNQSQYYKDWKNWWKDKKWSVEFHAKYNDRYVSYTVMDWIDGYHLDYWIDQLPYTSEGISNLVEMLKQYNTIINDLAEHNKINDDMHGRNILVVRDIQNPRKFQLKLVDYGRYRTPQANEDVEHIKAKQIRDLLNRRHLLNLWKALKKQNIGCDALTKALECIGSEWYGPWTAIRANGSGYSADKRRQLPNKLAHVASELKYKPLIIK